MNVALSNASFKKLMETDWTVVHIFMTIELSSGWQNVYVYAYVYICVWVRVCVCAHSLSVGDVGVLKQKPSLGFCLAGGFMQLSVLRGKKGRASLDFLYFRKTYFSFVLAQSIAS